MKKNTRDGGEAIVEAFRRLGVEYIVSSPGSEWSPVWEALSRQREDASAGPKYIQCWHETLAVSIATGITLRTGRPQAVLLHAAAGILQGAMGLFAAMRAEVPMVILTGESVTLGEDEQQEMEPQWYAGVSMGGSQQLVSAFVKWTSTVRSDATLFRSVVRAGEMAARVPRGPVHLDIPMEHMLHEWKEVENNLAVPAIPKTRAMPEDIQRIAKSILESENPIIVAEHSGADPLAFDALRDLAESLAVPVIGAPGACFSNFPYDHPLWLGVGAYHHLEEADLVLVIGARTPWYPPSKRVSRGRIIAVSEFPIKNWLIYQVTQADEYLEGDVAESLQLLKGAAQEIGCDSTLISRRREKWVAVHEELSSRLENERVEACEKNDLSVPAICEIVRQHLPADAIYVDETISHGLSLRRHLPLNKPQSLFRNTLGGLGQGIGLALGIKIASPKQLVVLFVGDGSFLYNPIIQGLGASNDYDVPILVIVLNNSGYSTMQAGHELYYPNSVARRVDFAFGVKISPPAFEELGSQFGFFGSRADSVPDFKKALALALTSLEKGKSAIINLAVPK